MCIRFAQKMWQECGAIVVPLWACPQSKSDLGLGMKDIISQMLKLPNNDDAVAGKKFVDLFPDEFESFMQAWGEYTSPYLGD